MFQVTRQGSQMIVDIHGMHAREARFRLDLLIDNAPEEVREKVKEVQKILGKRGALVVAPTHILEPEVPWENVLAFVDAARHSYYE